MAKRNFLGGNNPFLSEEKFREAAKPDTLDGDFIKLENKMTVEGAVNRTLILLGITILCAGIAFMMPNQIFMYVGVFGGAGVMMWANAKKELSPTLGPIFAALEGLFAGTVTAIYANALGAGIIFNAITLTLGLLFAMLFIYKAGWIKVTEKFRSAIMMATGAIMLVYLASWILSFFGMRMPFIHETGMLGIGISLFIIVIACMNFLLDFDNFEKGEQYGAPKYYEWFAAMGLLFNIVWLYVELLRLLSKLASSD